MDSKLVCGFEEGVFGPHWTAGALTPTFETSNPISGARSLRVNSSGAQSNCNALSIGSFGVGLITARFKVRFTSLSTTGFTIFHLNSNTGTGVYLGASNTIVTIADNTTGVNGVVVVTGIVYTVDVKIDKRNNPWTVDVQVNGIPCGQAVSATAGSTTAEQLRIGTQQGFGSGITIDALFDDVTISTTAADYPIGPGYVDPFVPTADGTHNIAGAADFQRGNSGTDILNATTTAFQLVDDVPLPSGTVDEADNIRAVAPPNATDYVECVFGPAPGIATPTVAPRAVDVVLAHHQIATQVGQSIVELNDNGTIDTIFDTGAAAGVVTYRYANKHYAAGPAGPWVIGGGGNGDFTDLRCRFRAPDATPDQCLDAIMIEAEFDGPLLTKQTLDSGTDTTVGDDLTAEAPTSYGVNNDITETVSAVVTTTIYNETADGEVPQQQCVLESQGGDEIGQTIVNPGQRIRARVQVSGANTPVGLSGTLNP